jgi:ComF family protein
VYRLSYAKEAPEGRRQRCILCLGAASGFGFCAECRGDLPWRKRLILRSQLPYLDQVFGLFVYRHPIDHLIRDFKFQCDMAALRACAEMLENAVSDHLQDIDLVLPVPLGPKRYRARAYNQAAILAAPLARALNRPLAADAVRRISERGAQSLLAADQRRANMAGAFRVDRSVAGLNILLIDDVLTTGSTLVELAFMLRRSKARGVQAVALAVSPLLP